MTLALTESAICDRLVEALSASDNGCGATFFREMFVQDFARRADLVVANETLSAFEIKSARDSLDRLDGQLDVYAQHFEQVTVVAATKHVSAVFACVPRRVGVWEVMDSGQLIVHRRATSRRVPKSKLLTFLPVDELRSLVRATGQSVAGTRMDLLKSAQTVRYDSVREFVLRFMGRRMIRIQAKKQRRSDSAHAITALQQQRQDQEAKLASYLAKISEAGTIRAIPRRVA
ncbi:MULTISPECIES: sce7726 family protein [Burkholderia]|uniref:sce7726 family protein n=1 Tax=Burkholderia TaxID=32008 RepID=UPI0005B7291F|nr:MULTISPECIES: sce7726 family protein [Burkholderia]KIS58356.1 hypothetical protein BTP_986 [Burkholderia thailandensis Phuket 4W-1]OJA53736.1 hypothetical protein BGV69_24630 [Burkholderia ubonensis]